MNEQVKPPAKPEGVRELPSEPVIRWLTREEVAASQAAWVGRATVHWHYDHDVDQAVALEREAILALIDVRYQEMWKQMEYAITKRGPADVRDARAFGRIAELARLTEAIRNGEHQKEAGA